jgi:Putative glucoamylase
MSPRPRTALYGAAAATGLAVLTWFAAFHVGFLIRIDHSILAGFAGLQRPAVDGPANFIAQLCDPQPYLYLAVLPVLVALVRGQPRVAVMMGAVMLGANVSSQVLKPLLAAPRGPGLPGPGQQLAQCTTCATEDTVSPHASAIALPVLPEQAYGNLQTLRDRYPGIYTHDGGFYDAVNPTTGSIGHRRLVLDQSMIMAALDDALTGGLQRYFAQDPESYTAKLYLGWEHMSIH